MSDPIRAEVVIVGSGFAGLCMAIKLKQAGIEDFVVLEKADRVGGTWRENTYPGCGCDVMSLMYSYSFAPNREWTRMYARQAEILDYIERTVDEFGIRPHLRLGVEVTGFDFVDAADRWQVHTAEGADYDAHVVVAGLGPLHKPSVPDFPGRERFAGASFHSAEWDHSQDLAGKRVAVIGTGASAVQFIPQLAKVAGQVEVFQRTPHWLLPKLDRALTTTEKRLFRRVPGVQKAYRNAIYWTNESAIAAFMHPKFMTGLEAVARRQLKRQVPDAELRAKLTPDYTIGCKRILVSSNYYPALQRSNVDLVTDGISEITERGVRTADGIEHEVDVIVYGTGFVIGERFQDDHLVGRDGLTIQQAWREGMEGFLGVAVSGFPNFFLLMGPNSGGGNQSIVFMIEAQVRYIIECLAMTKAAGATRIEVRAGVQRQWNRRAQQKLAGSVWNSGGCDSWYLDEHGVNRAAWPGSSVSYWWTMRHPSPHHFELTGAEIVEADVHQPQYQGKAELDGLSVDVVLDGHLEPLDGRYHWYGRIEGTPAVIAAKGKGRGEVQLTVDGVSASCRLGELDPWGNVRVSGVGPPPFAAPELADA